MFAGGICWSDCCLYSVELWEFYIKYVDDKTKAEGKEEQRVEILKKALAAKAVENEVLRADYNDVKVSGDAVLHHSFVCLTPMQAASQRILPGEAESCTPPEPKRAADPAPPILLDAMVREWMSSGCSRLMVVPL